VLAYWGYVAAGMSEGWGVLNRWVAPLLGEANLLFLVFVCSLEANTNWHPAIWSIVAIGLLLLHKPFHFPQRFKQYSWWFHMASAVQLAFVVSTQESPSMDFLERPWVLGVIAIFFQLAYVIIAYADDQMGEPCTFPPGLKWIRGLHSRFLTKWKNPAIFYPFAFAIAIFLYWRFDHGVLTLLWVAEVLGLLVLGTFLKEKHFVSFSLAALAACVGRLFIYDLARSDIGVKAAVFIAVGIIMFSIHIIRKKYGDRISG